MDVIIIILASLFLIVLIMGFAASRAKEESDRTDDLSSENAQLRNMRDSTGHFYVARFHAPYYKDDNWEATIESDDRPGYYTSVNGKTKIELEKNIDDVYRKHKEQWDREDLMAFKIGVNPYELYKKSPETSTSSSDFLNSIEVTFSVFGYDELRDTTFDMKVKDSDYEWLQDAEELESDHISKNRERLHKKIIRAIRENMKERALDPDDGIVEVYVSGSHRKEFHEQASNDYANSFAEDDDIEYTVTL